MLIDEFVRDYLPSKVPPQEIMPFNAIPADLPAAPQRETFQMARQGLVSEMEEQVGHRFGELGPEVSHKASRIRAGIEEVSGDTHQGLGSVAKGYDKTNAHVRARIGESQSPFDLVSLSPLKILWHNLFGNSDSTNAKGDNPNE
jgi:hypothetical protein